MNINKKIKSKRVELGYTLDNLAELTGFTKGYLSKIERSSKTPPFATVQMISKALHMDIVELMDVHANVSGSKNLDIMKGSDTQEEDWEKSGTIYSFKPLINVYREKYMSPFIFRVKKGETDVTTHDSVEFVYVLEGKVALQYEDKIYPLEKGDSFYLDARIKHNFVNREEQPALLIAVHFNYRRF
jgi:transcriptional regulator with XRE-family HTH domain